MLRRHKMRRYTVSAEEVNKLFPGHPQDEQRRLLSRWLHLDVKLDGENFLIWSRSLVKFTFTAELVPAGKDDPDVNVYNRGGCPLLPGVFDAMPV